MDCRNGDGKIEEAAMEEVAADGHEHRVNTGGVLSGGLARCGERYGLRAQGEVNNVCDQCSCAT